MADALALRADERRDKLRKASGRGKYPLIRRYLNGETCLSSPQASLTQSISQGREPGELKHLSKPLKKSEYLRIFFENSFITESRWQVESGIKDLGEWASEGESKVQ